MTTTTVVSHPNSRPPASGPARSILIDSVTGRFLSRFLIKHRPRSLKGRHSRRRHLLLSLSIRFLSASKQTQDKVAHSSLFSIANHRNEHKSPPTRSGGDLRQQALCRSVVIHHTIQDLTHQLSQVPLCCFSLLFRIYERTVVRGVQSRSDRSTPIHHKRSQRLVGQLKSLDMTQCIIPRGSSLGRAKPRVMDPHISLTRPPKIDLKRAESGDPPSKSVHQSRFFALLDALQQRALVVDPLPCHGHCIAFAGVVLNEIHAEFAPLFSIAKTPEICIINDMAIMTITIYVALEMTTPLARRRGPEKMTK